jgi:hypothetical protein
MTEEQPIVALSLQAPRAFDFSLENRSTAGQRWTKWIRECTRYLNGSGVKNGAQKLDTLLYLVGPDVSDIYDTMTKTNNTFEEAVTLLTAHFLPLKNLDFEYYNFGQMRQKSGESVDDFVVRLKEAGKRCEYATTVLDAEIKKQVILGCKSEHLKEAILAKVGCTVSDILTMARTSEAVRKQAQCITKSEPEYAVKSEPIGAIQPRQAGSSRGQLQMSESKKDAKDDKGAKRCFSCNRAWPHEGECPAKNRKCNTCGTMGHFSACCKQIKDKQVNKPIRALTDHVNDAMPSETEDEYLFNIVPMRRASPQIAVLINDECVNMIIDSGAPKDIIDEATFRQLRRRPVLRVDNARATAYQQSSSLETLGVFDATIRVNGNQCRTVITVAAGSYGCLLGHPTALALNLYQTDQFVGSERVHAVAPRYAGLVDQFPMVFNDSIGKLRDFKAHIYVDRSIRPVQAANRRLPYNIVEAVDRELDCMLEQGVIEEVDRPTAWVSAMHVVPKAKKPGAVRITLDSKQLNKAVERVPYVMPTTTEIAYDLNGATVFSQLDLNKAFHQIDVDEESRDLSTFVTHRGFYRYTRLHMGIKPASHILIHALQSCVIGGLEGVRAIADNILVFGKTVVEHDKRLLALCERLKQSGLTVGVENCTLGVSEIEFFGLRISAHGVAPSWEKLEALKNAENPSDASQVRSFLGLANFCSPNIPHLASLASPLWELTHEGVKFVWEEKHEQAMSKIKAGIITSALGFFDRDWCTEVIVDASPVGLAAVCTQFNPENSNERKIVTFVSKMLTDVEQRYAQVEKEAYAVVWACERLHLYLFGIRFRMVTDNRAVQLIFSKPTSKPNARILRWALRVMCYDFEIVHRPGRDNIADYLSRHPVVTDFRQKCEDVEDYVCFVVEHAIPKAMSKADIEVATLADVTLQALVAALQGRRDLKQDELLLIRPYAKVMSELTVTAEGIVLRDSRIVVPKALQMEALRIAHEGHLGISKTKGLLRTKVWFPGMVEQVEVLVGQCLACQLNSRPVNEPIKATKMPEKVWEFLCMDFYGPIPNGHELMVVIDEHSRMPFVSEVKTTASEYVLPVLDELLSMFGVPVEIKSDNGPPFNGSNFQAFSKYMGFHHRKITPEWAQANGLAENFMKNLGKVIRSSVVDQTDWRQELNKFLRSYRSAPHSSTGVAPFSLFFRREVKTRLPCTLQRDVNRDELVGKALVSDGKAKEKSSNYQDKRRKACLTQFNVGDKVFVRQKRTNKFMTNFSPHMYKVIDVNGCMVTVRDPSGRTFARNSSRYKLASVENDSSKVTRDDERGEKPLVFTMPSEVVDKLNKPSENCDTAVPGETETQQRRVSARKRCPVDRLNYGHD